MLEEHRRWNAAGCRHGGSNRVALELFWGSWFISFGHGFAWPKKKQRIGLCCDACLCGRAFRIPSSSLLFASLFSLFRLMIIDPNLALAHTMTAVPPVSPFKLDPRFQIVEAVEALQNSFGLCSQSATMIALAGVAACAGEAYCLRMPLGGNVFPGFLWMMAHFDTGNTRAAVGAQFAPLLQSNHEKIWKPDTRLLDKKHIALLRSRHVQSLNAIHKHENRIAADTATSSDPFLRQADEELKSAQAAKTACQQEALAVLDALHPGKIASPLRLQDYLGLRHGGGIFSLDVEGTAFQELLQARDSVKLDLARLACAGVDVSPIPVKGVFKTLQCLSWLTCLPTHQIHHFLGDEQLKASGLLSRALVIFPEITGPEKLSCARTAAAALEFARNFSRLFGDRHTAKVPLECAESTYPVFDWLLQKQKELTLRYPDFEEMLAELPRHASRLALLLHLTLDKTALQLDGETLRVGASLAVRLMTRMLEQFEQGRMESEVRQQRQLLQTLVNKVQDRQRISRRDLQRSFHNMKAGKLSDLLDTAITRGLIKEKDGMLEARPIRDVSDGMDLLADAQSLSLQGF